MLTLEYSERSLGGKTQGCQQGELDWTCGGAGPTISSLLYWLAMQCPHGKDSAGSGFVLAHCKKHLLTVQPLLLGQGEACQLQLQTKTQECNYSNRISRELQNGNEESWSFRLDMKGASWRKPEKTRRKLHQVMRAANTD